MMCVKRSTVSGERSRRGVGFSLRRRSGSGFDFILTGEAMQASDADRVAVEVWLRERSELSDWTVGELRDLQEE